MPTKHFTMRNRIKLLDLLWSIRVPLTHSWAPQLRFPGCLWSTSVDRPTALHERRAGERPGCLGRCLGPLALRRCWCDANSSPSIGLRRNVKEAALTLVGGKSVLKCGFSVNFPFNQWTIWINLTLWAAGSGWARNWLRHFSWRWTYAMPFVAWPSMLHEPVSSSRCSAGEPQ